MDIVRNLTWILNCYSFKTIQNIILLQYTLHPFCNYLDCHGSKICGMRKKQFAEPLFIQHCSITYICTSPEFSLGIKWLIVKIRAHLNSNNLQSTNLKLYVPCIMFQCVDKPTRCNTSYEWSLLSIIWLYTFRTITSPTSGASSHTLYNALVCSCYQAMWMYIHIAW